MRAAPSPRPETDNPRADNDGSDLDELDADPVEDLDVDEHAQYARGGTITGGGGTSVST